MAMSSLAEFVIRVLLVNGETRTVRLDERTEVTVSETPGVCSGYLSFNHVCSSVWTEWEENYSLLM